MLPPFVINLVFLTFIFLMTKIPEITNMIVNYRISLFSVIKMLVYSVPFFLEYIIPMSIMMAVLLSFIRMSGDNEIVALKSSGVSPHTLLVPVVLFCLGGCLFTGFIAFYGLPWGHTAFKKMAYELISSNPDIGLKERTFNDSFEGIMLYVNKIDVKNRQMIDVFIEDRRSGTISTIVAPKGTLVRDPDKTSYHMRLYNGTINQVGFSSKSVYSVSFKTYDINLDIKGLSEIPKAGSKDKDGMSFTEMNGYLENKDTKDNKYNAILMKYHEKFSIPFACFALGILALPLGLQSKTDKKLGGIITGLVLFLVYYLLLSVGWSFGESGAYPPVVGMWMPNIIMGGIGLYLYSRAAKDRPLYMGWLSGILKQMMQRKFN